MTKTVAYSPNSLLSQQLFYFSSKFTQGILNLSSSYQDIPCVQPSRPHLPDHTAGPLAVATEILSIQTTTKG